MLYFTLDPGYWQEVAQEELREALYNTVNTNIAKNVILFIGDGLSLSTVTAARIFKGQQAGGPGEDEKLKFETLDHVALAKVRYCKTLPLRVPATYEAKKQLSFTFCLIFLLIHNEAYQKSEGQLFDKGSMDGKSEVRFGNMSRLS